MSKKDETIILGIESSCDETAAAVVKITSGRAGRFSIISNVVSSQIKIHQKFGGVVPEVAARNHIINIIPVIDQALVEAKIKPAQIDRIAVTTGPGLITSLLVGVETAKTLAYAWQKPIISINHLKAHLYANWLNNQTIKFPAVCLIVSGGHTELILINRKRGSATAPVLKKIGQTLDDAAGEAFDKVAQLLKIGYPGGPIISKLALQGNPKAFNFARPMINSNDFNFSFSGLKTSVLYTVQKLRAKSLEPRAQPFDYAQVASTFQLHSRSLRTCREASEAERQSSRLIADLCASFQQAAVDVLAAKTFKAALNYQTKTVMLAGGVAANQLLRENLKFKVSSLKLDFLMPKINLCTDNAAMIAAAGFFEKPIPWQKLKVDPNLEIS